jgi:hypothetical protein
MFVQRHNKNKILINIKQYIIHQNLNTIFHLVAMIYGRFEHFVSVRIHACTENWVTELTNRLYTMSHAHIIYSVKLYSLLQMYEMIYIYMNLIETGHCTAVNVYDVLVGYSDEIYYHLHYLILYWNILYTSKTSWILSRDPLKVCEPYITM